MIILFAFQVDDRTDVRLQMPWDEPEREWTHEEAFNLITLDGTAAKPTDLVVGVRCLLRRFIPGHPSTFSSHQNVSVPVVPHAQMAALIQQRSSDIGAVGAV